MPLKVTYKDFQNIKISLDFDEDSFMSNDLRDIRKLTNSDYDICVIYFTKGDGSEFCPSQIKNIMEGLRMWSYPNTIFITSVKNPDNVPPEESVDEAMLNDIRAELVCLKEAGFIDFNMYTNYEFNVAMLYSSPEVIPVYDYLLNVYSNNDLPADSGKKELVEAILNDLRVKYSKQ